MKWECSIYCFAAVTFLTLTTSADALTLTCVGEPISSRAIGGNQATTSAFADSAITAKGGEDCFFFSLSSVGRQIARGHLEKWRLPSICASLIL
jgi:hypothetical protein